MKQTWRTTATAILLAMLMVLGAMPLTAFAGENVGSPWNALAAMLDAEPGTDLGTITLDSDLIGGSDSDYLFVPAGVTVILDLAGHSIDGSATAASQGRMLEVRGHLTIIDSKGTGRVTGGVVKVLAGAKFIVVDTLSECFGASMVQYYLMLQKNAGSYAWIGHFYAITYFQGAKEALTAAAQPERYNNYKDELADLPEDDNWFNYYDPIVMLYQDATVAEGETWEVDSDSTIRLDLNGFTFDVQGTLTGGVPYTRYEDGEEISGFQPTPISIDSGVPGVFRSSGTIGVSIQPWTADTYYITGGEIGGRFAADGGTIHISGGRFTGGVFFNNGSDKANLDIYLSGNAELQDVEVAVYADEEQPTICMTVSDNVRIAGMTFEVMGEGGTKPNLILEGGYYDVDPQSFFRGLRRVPDDEVDYANLAQYYGYLWGDYLPYTEIDSSYREYVTDYYLYDDACYADRIQLKAEPEEYAGQLGWAADRDIYTWRIGGSDALFGDLDGSGVTNMADAFLLYRAVSGQVTLTAAQEAISDLDGSGTINMADAFQLYRAVSGQ
ncbi:MAG: dockerin type I repeat-containing protein [Clostridia bacterium]|nr:dockerin type I repeat-containing protein [Clostridia bacterium]